MRVLFIANMDLVHTPRYVKEFKNKGHEVFIISLNYTNKSYYEDLANIIDYPFFPQKFASKIFLKFIRFVFYSIFINRIIRKYEIQGVVAINLAFGGAIAAHIYSKIKKIGITLGDEFKPIKWYDPQYFFINKYSLRKTILKLDNIVTADEEYFKPFLKKNNLFFEEKFLFIGTTLGVNVDDFSPTKKNIILRKELFNVNQDAILALCFREPRPEFDFENIIRTIAKLVKKHRNLYFAIGKGNVDCTDLINLSIELKIEKNILFIENVAYTNLANYIAQGDVFIDPVNLKKNNSYINNGVSQALIESMSCGLIPVISNRPSIKWILPPETESFIYEDLENDLQKALDKALKAKDNLVLKNIIRNAIVQKANKNKIMNIIVELLKNN